MTSYPQYIRPLPVDVRVKPPSHDFQDPSSHSWPGRHFVTHIDLDFTIDFTAKLIHGIANIHFELLSGSTTLTLDVRGITIKSIIYGKDRHLPYTIDHLDSSIGAALNISLPSNIGILDIPFHTITIAYTTPGNGDGHPAGGALDWLSPEQTSSGEPFAFTQCQSIHARSIIPCQDTSTVKSTYNALGRVAPPFDHLTLVMSAQHVSSKETKNGVSFSCGVPIPSYLIAFACGKLEYRNLSKRCAVWAEPSIIDKAESEFSETDSMLESAENIAGPYVWGRYDLIVLPGSFPYGGMENPFLTFVTPTLLAGDRSMTNVIVHEIAHSWSGNLVSCQDTRHFWLNEGFTVKLERQILRAMYGSGREGLDGVAGRRDLQDYISSVGEELKYTTLVSQIQTGEDPDLYFSIVPYEKGYNFLMLLEQAVEKNGGSFLDWLRKYFQDYRYQSINTDDFLSSFESAFPKVSEHIDWKAWLHGEGYLPEIPELDMSLANEAVELATQWLSLFRDVDDLEYDVAIRKCRDVLGSKVEEFAQWDAKQQHGFVTDLRARIVAGEEPEPIVWNVKCPGYLEDIHGFNEISNSEVRFMWCRLALLGCYEGVLENTRNFVSIQGRMKYVRPLYKDMHEIYPKGDYSVDLFAINKSSYHSITVKMIELDLGLSSERKAKG